MRRRDVLRLGTAALGAGVLGSGTTAAHPGPYRPYGSVDVDGATEAVVGPDGKTVFVAATTGYAVVDVAIAAEPRVVADRRRLLADRENGPMRMTHDVKVDAAGERLLVVGPANPSPGALSGMLVVDVSDPMNPAERGFFETDYAVHNCFLDGDYAYLSATDFERNPLVVVDVSDPENPTEVARWSILDHDPAWEQVAPLLRVVHDVYVQDGVAYLAQWEAGTWLLDVSDPTNPTYISNFSGQPIDDLASLSEEAARGEQLTPPGNDHYVTVDDDASVLGIGREAWARRTDDGELVGGPAGIDLYDLSEPTAPTHLSTIDPPPSPRPTFDGLWTTAHNFELSGERLYSSWYQGGVKRHDVSDPTNPKELTWWRKPQETRFWTARLGVPGETFVASSMGFDDERDASPGIYVFPDHAGQQVDAPSLGNASTDDGPEVLTASPTPAGASGASANGSSAGSSVASPGFGVGVGAAALGAGAWWLDRRARRRNGRE